MKFKEYLEEATDIDVQRIRDPSCDRSCLGRRGTRLGIRHYVISVICIIMVYFVTCAPAEEQYSWFKSIKSGLLSAKTAGCRLAGIECCSAPFLRLDKAVPALRETLHREFFGQHLALQTTLLALEAHIRDPNPGKALVLSFHGWAGSGKTYLTQHISKALYEKGIDSRFVKFFMSSRHFPDPTKIMEYKQRIQDEITEITTRCPHSLFIFDEVDKTPPGVFDAIVPFIEIPGRIDDVYYNKAIFIFLSNAGSNEITQVSKAAWEAGKRRENLTFRDFENHIVRGTFNNQHSGLFRSSIIDRALIDYFIPFLPMERRHVMQCVEMEARRQRANVNAEEIADKLEYWPADIKLYSSSGCKRVEGAVKYAVEEERIYGSPKAIKDIGSSQWNTKEEL